MPFNFDILADAPWGVRTGNLQMRQSLIVFVILLCAFFPINAQESPAPRLRIASPQELLDTAREVFENYNTEPDTSPTFMLSYAVFNVLDTLVYHPDANITQLMEGLLLYGENTWIVYGKSWGQRIVQLWLAEMQPDFSREPTHTFGDFTVQATPMDFNVDDRPEWVLNITTESNLYRQLLVATGDIGALALVETPLPWFSDFYGYNYVESGEIKPILFEDLTGDGRPEWVLASLWPNGFDDYGELYVLTWAQDRLRLVLSFDYSATAPHPYTHVAIPHDIDIEFIDLNHDGTTEIIQHQDINDNWACKTILRNVYLWNPSAWRYVKHQESLTETYSVKCDLRDAQLAMWDGRYSDAIAGYQRYLRRPSSISIASELDTELYVRIRLVLAYAITGQEFNAQTTLDKAIDLLENADNKTNDPFIATFVQQAHAAYQPGRDAIVLCDAMYTASNDYLSNSSSNGYWGLVTTALGSVTHPQTPNGGANKSGCDLDQMMVEALADPDRQHDPDIQVYRERLRIKHTYEALLYPQNYIARLWRYYIPRREEFELTPPIPTAIYDRIHNHSPKTYLESATADYAQFKDHPEYGGLVRYVYADALYNTGFEDSDIAAAYQSVIDFAPDSAWAILATLHIE